MTDDQPTLAGPFASSYLRLCQRQGKPVVAALEPRAGDWVLSRDGLRLLTDPSERRDDEIVVPDLDRVLQLLWAEAAGVILDCQEGEVACSAFDDHNRSLANVISRNAPEAVLRALLFVLAERRSNEIQSNTIQLQPAKQGRS